MGGWWLYCLEFLHDQFIAAPWPGLGFGVKLRIRVRVYGLVLYFRARFFVVRVRGRVNLREVAEGQQIFTPLIGHAGLAIVSAVVQHPLQLVFIPTRKVVGVHLLGFTVRVTGVTGGYGLELGT